MIPVTRELVTGIKLTNYKDFIVEHLEDCPKEDKLSRLKHIWSMPKFGQLPKKPTKLKLLEHTRAYLLYLVSTTIFVDASQRSTLISYLQLLRDLDEAGKYAWGAVALAFLYRSLSKVADRESHFSGLATLL
ncbi:hypothetical protein AMTR_s00002p00258220 [Amborella trichopoda]|uniref:Aminotransferase-like plant mobile domain-containing protein n=1 Tax=Amborella trichopoda TaxID=13333 RepID=W1P315_AMBTC|nr:hypothetical protein AMTR_s00002p00258220 [Amborella trichopoda]